MCLVATTTLMMATRQRHEPEKYYNMEILTYGDGQHQHYRLFVEVGMEGDGYCPPEICSQLPRVTIREQSMGFVHRILTDFKPWLHSYLSQGISSQGRGPGSNCGCKAWVDGAVKKLMEGSLVGFPVGGVGRWVDVSVPTKTPSFRPNMRPRRRAEIHPDLPQPIDGRGGLVQRVAEKSSSFTIE